MLGIVPKLTGVRDLDGMNPTPEHNNCAEVMAGISEKAACGSRLSARAKVELQNMRELPFNLAVTVSGYSTAIS